MVICGAPRVGTSDFLLNLLPHMPADLPFLDMPPSRPLKIFYLQAEVQYHYQPEDNFTPLQKRMLKLVFTALAHW